MVNFCHKHKSKKGKKCRHQMRHETEQSQASAKRQIAPADCLTKLGVCKYHCEDHNERVEQCLKERSRKVNPNAQYLIQKYHTSENGTPITRKFCQTCFILHRFCLLINGVSRQITSISLDLLRPSATTFRQTLCKVTIIVSKTRQSIARK